MTLSRIKLGEKEIILVGTAHISKVSVELAEKTIEEEKPDIVGVELDELRLHQLLGGNRWENTNVLTLIQQGQAGLVLLNLYLAGLQRQLGEKVGVKPGEEMLVAVKKAQEKKIPLLLLDRSLQITMKRALASISFLEKIKLGGSLIVGLFGEETKIDEKKIEEMKQTDLITKLMEELSKQYPKLKKTLVDERDVYISHALIQSPGKKIVAIVGAGHVNGILSHLLAHKEGRKDQLIPLQELTIVPTKKKTRYGEWCILLAFIGIIIWLFWQKGVELSLQFFLFWFVGHGILAALGALLGGAHWTTAIGVFLTAWFAALHPLIAAGWIAAGLEAKRNSPNVKDFTNLNQLNSISAFRKNRVTQILLITVLCNLGSMLATFAVIPYLINILG